MKQGTLVKLPDGRTGRAVYHNIDGYGIRWGDHAISDEDLNAPPDAMLRAPYPGAEYECVGEDYATLPAPEVK